MSQTTFPPPGGQPDPTPRSPSPRALPEPVLLNSVWGHDMWEGRLVTLIKVCNPPPRGSPVFFTPVFWDPPPGLVPPTLGGSRPGHKKKPASLITPSLRSAPAGRPLRPGDPDPHPHYGGPRRDPPGGPSLQPPNLGIILAVKKNGPRESTPAPKDPCSNQNEGLGTWCCEFDWGGLLDPPPSRSFRWPLQPSNLGIILELTRSFRKQDSPGLRHPRGEGSPRSKGLFLKPE